MCELYGNRCFDSMVESRYVLTGRIFKECRTKCPLDCVNVVYKSRFDRFGFRLVQPLTACLKHFLNCL